jgi:hypothetical protein
MRSFGKLVHVHSPRLVGKAFGVLLAATMTVGMWWAIRVMNGPHPVYASLFALGFTIITIVLAVSWWRDRSLQIKVYEHGIGWKRVGQRSELHFSEISAISEYQVNGKPSALYLQLRTGGQVMIPSDVTDHDRLVATLTANVG